MIVKRFFEPALAQTSYLIGCGMAGEAIVIDPHRDADLYITAAGAHDLRITHVTETHIHADFLSGSRELAHRTGAALLLSDEGDEDWKYAFADEGRLIRGGDRITIGNVAIDVVHTPGHTPEHLTFLITDGAVADAPIAAATGDFIFVGDVGRPDLLERAARVQGTMEQSARTLVSQPAGLQRARGVAADLAWTRRRLVVRQGDLRGPAQHARLRAALQLGVQGEGRGRVRRQRAGRAARSADAISRR